MSQPNAVDLANELITLWEEILLGKAPVRITRGAVPGDRDAISEESGQRLARAFSCAARKHDNLSNELTPILFLTRKSRTGKGAGGGAICQGLTLAALGV